MTLLYFVWAWKDAGITEPSERLVLMSLGEMADNEGETPAIAWQKLAESIGISASSAKRHVKSLISKKIIEKVVYSGSKNSFKFTQKVSMQTQVNLTTQVNLVTPNLPGSDIIKDLKELKDISMLDVEPIVSGKSPDYPPSKKKTGKEPVPQFIKDIACAIADVCGQDAAVAAYRHYGLAGRLSRIEGAPNVIRKHYGPGGWWYKKDWRGQKGQWPNETGIIDTWRKWEKENSDSDTKYTVI